MERRGNILCVFGTRPEAIKLAPVIRAMEADARLNATVCVTGQHRQMLDPLLKFFGITPDVDLDIMRPGQDLIDALAKLLPRLRDEMDKCRPDCVLVQGDTMSVMATSLAAFYAKVPVAHLEAGLRTWNLQSPWPEEMNRRIATLAAGLHFSPTQSAGENLRGEGVPEDRLVVTGNTVIDALLDVVKRIDTDASLRAELDRQFQMLNSDRRIILLTSHRRENIGEGLTAICRAVATLSQRDDVQVVFPIHLNPDVQEIVQRELRDVSNVVRLPPQDYVPFVYLMRRAEIVLTDSGGIQEEAPSLGKPVLVLRDLTERPEGITAGTVKLVGTNEDNIVTETNRLLDDSDAYDAMARSVNPYGDGKASLRVVARLVEEFIDGHRPSV